MLKKEMPEWYAEVWDERGYTWFADIWDMEDLKKTAEYFGNGGLIGDNGFFIVHIRFFLGKDKHIDYYFNHNIY